MTVNILDKRTVQEQIYELNDGIIAQDEKIESASQTATNALTRADSAQETANNAMTRADSAQSTANDAMTRADSAQADANTAKATADTAQSTADTAKATADTAQTDVSKIINGETWVQYANLANLAVCDDNSNNIAGTYATKTALKAVSDVTDAIAPLDTTPTEGSTKGVTSGGVQSAISSVSTVASNAQATADTAVSKADSAQTTADSADTKVDNIINGTTCVPYANVARCDGNARVIANTYATKTELEAVSDVTDAIAPLDTAPTQGSTKGVTSGGVYEAIQAGGGGGLTIDVITDQFTFATGIEKYAGEILKINNKLILFQLEIKNTNSSSASSIGMMPSGTYPAETCAICTGHNSSNYLSYAFISASGAVTANRQAIPANAYGWFFGTYLISGGA